MILSGYYLPNVEIKNYNIVINGGNCFDQPIKKKHMVILEKQVM